MKIFLLLLIAVSTVVLSSARRDHKDHGPHGGGHHNTSDDSDTSHNDDFLIHDDDFHCRYAVHECSDPLQKYFERGFNDTLQKVRRAGAQIFCSELLEAKRCAATHFAESYCDGAPEYVRKEFFAMSSVLDYVCKDKVYDLEEHWDCVTDFPLLHEVDNCAYRFRYCNITGFTDCATGAINLSSSCKSGATDFVKGVISKAPRFVYGCRDGEKILKSLKQFLAKK